MGYGKAEVVEQVSQWIESVSLVKGGVRKQRKEGPKELVLVHMEDTPGAGEGGRLESGVHRDGWLEGVKEAIYKSEEEEWKSRMWSKPVQTQTPNLSVDKGTTKA